MHRKKIPFINFWNPLYFEVRKGGIGGSTFQYPSDLKFMFLETSCYREWDQGDCYLKFESSVKMTPLICICNKL